MTIHYRHADVHGRKVFYREAGDPKSPTLLLLHGFPTSSFMFRDLIPLLAGRFHVIAPDYIGFGQSDAPSVAEFDYTFENLTAHVTGLIDQLGLASYILYMQDYGGPVGFRIFAERPQAVAGFVLQNTNAYLESASQRARCSCRCGRAATRQPRRPRAASSRPRPPSSNTWLARATRKRSALTTGRTTRRCSTGRAPTPGI
jgi:pimeloyl-ACP methyl ester carboxylesterase